MNRLMPFFSNEEHYFWSKKNEGKQVDSDRPILAIIEPSANTHAWSWILSMGKENTVTYLIPEPTHTYAVYYISIPVRVDIDGP